MHRRTTPRLLVIEDDPHHAASLRRVLTDNGFDATCTRGIGQARKELAREPADLVLTNLNFADGSARALLAEFQPRPHRPGFIIVSEVHGCAQQVSALDEGADDYIKKPYHPLDLVARVQAVLRRTGWNGAPGIAAQSPFLQSDWAVPFHLNACKRALVREQSDGSIEIALTEKSFLILQLLLAHPFQVLSRQRIAEAYFSRDHVAGSRSIDVEIAKLRKTIGDDPHRPVMIRTARGKGYLFTPQNGPAWPQPGQQCLRLAP